MKYYNLVFLMPVLILILNACNQKKHNLKNHDSPTTVATYFGQNPPGMTAEIFAPEIVSINGRNEYGISFSPDNDELYFSASKNNEVPDIYFSKLEGGKWTNPEIANLIKDKKDAEMHPFVNFSNNRIYFTAHNSDYTDTKIWYVNRYKNTWSEPVKSDSPINNDEVFYANQSKNRDFFYTNLSKGKMYYAPNIKGEYPKIYPVEIEFGFHGFISPTQDFLVVNARNQEDGERADNDIYIYFKENDGTWSKPINLGNEVNSSFDETCPSITPDGKYLIFSRYNEKGEVSNFYWVSTEIIKRLKKAYFKK